MKKISKFRLTVYTTILVLVTGFGVTLFTVQAMAKYAQENGRAATIQITAISNCPDYSKPWQSKGTESASGSGAIISGNRILTNAHVVANAVNIEVKRTGMTDKHVATVAYISHACDLAILTVAEDVFFDGVDALELGELPDIQTEVHAYGYPIGGETASTTSGVVSRIEVDTYSHSFRSFMTVQIDAAINPGNSGGPVLSGGKLVGIAMQTLEEGENVGYMIPEPVIRHFLEDVEDGNVDGAPQIGGEFQPLESAALRASLGLKKDETGMYTNRLSYQSSGWKVLEPGDVVLDIDGIPVANDGTIPFNDDQRIDMANLIYQKQVGESVEITVLRNGIRKTLSLNLNSSNMLVPYPQYPNRATYRIFAGLVFQPLDFDYLIAIEELEIEIPSYMYYLALEDNIATPDQQELVVLSGILPHQVNRGYQDWKNYVVAKVQGQPVRDMKHFNQLLDEVEGNWIEISFRDHSILVLDLEEAQEANEQILQNFSIGADRFSTVVSIGLIQ